MHLPPPVLWGAPCLLPRAGQGPPMVQCRPPLAPALLPVSLSICLLFSRRYTFFFYSLGSASPQCLVQGIAATARLTLTTWGTVGVGKRSLARRNGGWPAGCTAGLAAGLGQPRPRVTDSPCNWGALGRRLGRGPGHARSSGCGHGEPPRGVTRLAACHPRHGQLGQRQHRHNKKRPDDTEDITKEKKTKTQCASRGAQETTWPASLPQAPPRRPPQPL